MTETTFEVKHDQKRFDITTFLKHHPGGINYIEHYKDKDVSEKMRLTGHSEAARYLLREYKKDGRDQEVDDEENEDLEHLVDWSKPMLNQVASLGSIYEKWVYLPVDREIRLFKSDFLERLSYTPWYSVIIVWPPIAIWMMIRGYHHYMDVAEDKTNFLPVYLSFIFGIFSWTLAEYMLHKFLFHMPTNVTKWKIFVHFMLHGLHHKAPFDTRRLVFPVTPALLANLLFFSIFKQVLPDDIHWFFYSGFLISYVIYDLTHYYIHAGNPKEGTYLYEFKRIHHYHHFRHHDKGFGLTLLSYSMWDKILGTTIKLKNLKIGIKWQ